LRLNGEDYIGLPMDTEGSIWSDPRSASLLQLPAESSAFAAAYATNPAIAFAAHAFCPDLPKCAPEHP
jgi:hypothetical protein